MTADDERRDADRAALLRAIDAAVLAGERVPCIAGDALPADHWTSDDADEQHLAALACEGCPALTLCRDYGLTHRREVGVYGAMTYGQRKPRLGRPPKSQETSA